MIIESWITRDDSPPRICTYQVMAPLRLTTLIQVGVFFRKKKNKTTHRMQLRCQKTPFPGGFCGVLMWQNSVGSNWWTLSNASIFYSAPGQLSCLECSHSKLQILLAHFENLRQEVLQVGPTYVTVPFVSSHHLFVFPRHLEPPMKAWQSDVDKKSVEQAKKSSSSSYSIMVAMSTGDSLIRAFDLETLGAVFCWMNLLQAFGQTRKDWTNLGKIFQRFNKVTSNLDVRNVDHKKLKSCVDKLTIYSNSNEVPSFFRP